MQLKIFKKMKNSVSTTNSMCFKLHLQFVFAALRNVKAIWDLSLLIVVQKNGRKK
jgi:hypothetical protein